jgi:acyl-CoA thioester hydrolase
VFYYLIKSIIQKNKKPTHHLYDQVVFKHHVKLSYIDIYKHINNAKYLRIYEKARWDFGIKTGMTKLMLQKKYLFLIMSAEVTYVKELKLGQEFDVYTKIIATDDKYYYFEQQMKRGEVVHNHAFFKVLIAGRKKVSPKDVHEMIYDKPFEALNHPIVNQWKHFNEMKKNLNNI